MDGKIFITYSSNKNEFMNNFECSVKNQPSLDQLIINDVPSSLKGYQLITQNWFETKVFSNKQLIGINLKINGNLDDLPEKLDLDFLKTRILITFQSIMDKYDSKSYWKSDESQKFYTLSIEDDSSMEVTDFCHEFITEEIKNGNTGIIERYQQNSRIRIHEIGDSNDGNLLVIAITNNLTNIVDNLLKQDFDADDGIDVAWNIYQEQGNNEKLVQIMMLLLRANSRLPESFEYEKAPKEVQEFIDKCELLHQDVDADNFDELKKKIESEPNLIHFYDRYNESLLAYSLRMRKIKIFELLDKAITTGSHEDLDEVYENLLPDDSKLLREQHKSNAKEFPETHIFVLRSKCRIGNNDQMSQKKWKYIDEAFEIINSNDYCKKILRVAAECKKLKIYFDFKHDSTYYLDPATSSYSKGIIYSGGSIFIGAKYLTDDEMKYEVFGVIAHEMCHLAVYMSFMNRNFDPFPVGDSHERTRFIERVMTQCNEERDSEEIVGNVFESYPEDIQDSEMIVTVPQMLIHYVRNPEKIKELEKVFNELFNYSKEIVEPELDKSLPILKTLYDEEKPIKFENLTEPMKVGILHSKINFQGSKVTFNELIGNDVKILNILSPGNIRKILIKNINIEYSSICDLNLKYGLLERNFIEKEVSDKIKLLELYFQAEEVKKVQKDLESVKELNIFLLVDHAGSGKTTIFKDSAIKLKKLNRNYWISFINLRTYGLIFEKFKNKIEDLNLENVCEILLEMVDQESEMEKEIFIKLFSNGKTILLFDGFDEISPKYTDLVLKIFEVLMKQDLKNYFWVSTRPHCADKLENLLKVKAHKFTDCTNDEYLAFIMKILKQNKVPEDSSKANKVVQNVYYYIHNDIFIRPLINGASYVSKQSVENPLLIEMLTELFITDSIQIDTDNFTLYQKMIDKQKEKVGWKIPNLERDPSGKLSVWDVHTILSLLLIFGNDYVEELKFELESLAIMKKWKKMKKNWTSDMVQRYGFVIVDLDAEDLRSSIDFIHRTYAEYFVAEFLTDFMFDDNDEVSEAEVSRKFKMFDLVMKNAKNFTVILSFMVNFVKFRKTDEICDDVKELLIEKISKIHEMIKNSENLKLDDDVVVYFGNYSQFLMNDKDMLKRIWKLDGNNIIQDFIKKEYPLTAIADLAGFCFGLNWHQVMNKSNKNLTTDEELEKIKELDTDEAFWKYDKKFLKLCDLVGNNFDADVKKIFYEKFPLNNISTKEALALTFIKISTGCDKATFVSKFLIMSDIFDIFKENLSSAFTIIEKVLDSEEIRKFIFDIRQFRDLFRIILRTNNNNFRIIKDFFIKYKESWTDIQKLMLSNGIFYFISSTNFNYSFPCYNEFKEFIKEAFGDDTLPIANMIEQWNLKDFPASEASLDNLTDFFMYVFGNDQKKVSAVLSKFKFYKPIPT